MLRIHILNVSHGDSIVLEFEPELAAGEIDGPNQYAVIDCNGRRESNRALNLLREKGATRLEFLALTHPHTDHYTGIGEICDAFGTNIDAFFSFPVERGQEKLRSLLERYAAAGSTISELRSQSTVDFLKFFIAARSAQQWDDPAVSIPAPLDVRGFPGTSFHALLPVNSARGHVLPRLIQGNLSTQAPDLNDLSLALLITYGGRQAVLGADGTVVGWTAQAARWLSTGNRTPVSPSIVKLPHHGSQKDCTPAVVQSLFRTDDADKIAVISANGSSHHPHATVLEELARAGIKPYCTNLSERCGGTAKHLLSENNPDVSPELLRVLQNFATDPGRERPCQGDITIEISANGVVRAVPQFQHPCGFRGDWERWLSPPTAS